MDILAGAVLIIVYIFTIIPLIGYTFDGFCGYKDAFKLGLVIHLIALASITIAATIIWAIQYLAS